MMVLGCDSRREGLRERCDGMKWQERGDEARMKYIVGVHVWGKGAGECQMTFV